VAGCRRSHRQWAGLERRGTGGQGGSHELEEEQITVARGTRWEEGGGGHGAHRVIGGQSYGSLS
jgi:hypothetical protein